MWFWLRIGVGLVVLGRGCWVGSVRVRGLELVVLVGLLG